MGGRSTKTFKGTGHYKKEYPARSMILVLQDLCWLPVGFQVEIKVLLLIYKVINCILPEELPLSLCRSASAVVSKGTQRDAPLVHRRELVSGHSL